MKQTNIAYNQLDLIGQKLLVIAPHPDDAELGAFGLYSSHESMVVTVTAGEARPHFLTEVMDTREKATLLKGKLRAWDSVMVPQWGGVLSKNCVNLGYFDSTLEEMYKTKAKVISKFTLVDNTSEFRIFNQIKLKTDNEGVANWANLITDLKQLIDYWKPDCVVTTHPIIDSHSDHYYTSLAVQEALLASSVTAELLYFVIHNETVGWLSGPAGSLMTIPEGVDLTHQDVYSFDLTKEMQINKMCALEMMHDLRWDKNSKRLILDRIKNELFNCQINHFGPSEFYRKFCKSNELFYKITN